MSMTGNSPIERRHTKGDVGGVTEQSLITHTRIVGFCRFRYCTETGSPEVLGSTAVVCPSKLTEGRLRVKLTRRLEW